jgi:hypothetical protein
MKLRAISGLFGLPSCGRGIKSIEMQDVKAKNLPNLFTLMKMIRKQHPALSIAGPAVDRGLPTT